MEINDEERSYRATSRGRTILPTNVMWYDSEPEWNSWAIPTFSMINIVMFIVTMYTNNCPFHGGGRRGCLMGFLGRFSFQHFHQNSLLGPSSQTLMKMGAVDGAAISHYHQGWRLITSIWLHTGLIHLLVNLLSLLSIGIRLEQQFGFVRTTIIYILAGIGGNIISGLFVPSNVSVGASSALLGLIGAMFSELLTNWTLYANKAAAVITLLITLVISTVVAVVPYHGHFSHASGGFLTGFLLGFVLLARPIGWPSSHHYWTGIFKSKYKPYQYALGVSSLVLLVIGYIVGLVMLFRAKAKNG
ncbi:RHOMBOID-like protein 2 [Silene latifolia]|uniref:RHOMBOID-like protein 2 n=1 Tax=Silene latifolia TaxID=37657 RepID=UPI003D77DDBD